MVIIILVVVLGFPRSAHASLPRRRLFLYFLRGRRTSSFSIVSFVVAAFRVVLIERFPVVVVIVGIVLVLLVRVVSLVLPSSSTAAAQRFPSVPRRLSHALILVRMIRFPPPNWATSFLLYHWLFLLLLLLLIRRH